MAMYLNFNEVLNFYYPREEEEVDADDVDNVDNDDSRTFLGCFFFRLHLRDVRNVLVVTADGYELAS